MNKVSAVVTTIDKNDIVTNIHVECGGTTMRLIKSECPKWLSPGDKVFCTFQEASVCVSKECPGKVSIENKLPASLSDVRKSDSLCELTFSSDLGTVVSLITTDAFDDLELEVGCEATMLLRGVDIGLQPQLEPISVEALTQQLSASKPEVHPLV